MASYQSHDGVTVEVCEASCKELADILFKEMDSAHEDTSADFFVTSVMLIENIINEFRLHGMEDDHVLEYLLNFIKQGECH